MINNKKKILIIEDEMFIRDIYKKRIEKEDFEVIEAGDGETGLKEIERQKPDLVLLDVNLPDISGFEVLEQIRKSPYFSVLPVIILTNSGERESIEKGSNLGANDYLIKAHFIPKEVVQKIKAILG